MELQTIAEMTAAIAGLKGAKDAAKVLLDVNQQFSQAELRLQVIELVNQLSDATDKVVDLKIKVTELAEENASLKQQQKHKEELYFSRDKGTYWRKNNVDGSEDGLFARSAGMTTVKLFPWHCSPILIIRRHTNVYPAGSRMVDCC